MNGVPTWASDDPKVLRRIVANLKQFDKAFPMEKTKRRIADLERDIERIERNAK